jgi:hypothetical protein
VPPAREGFHRWAPQAKGRNGKTLARNAPTLLNVGFQSHLMWDGRANSLEQHALFPIQSPDEMNQDLSELERELNAIPAYTEQFMKVFGTTVTRQAIAKSLAAFERTLAMKPSRYDRYVRGERDAIARGAAPLEFVARRFEWPQVAIAVAVGAMTAMLGMLLNLILGLSRVALAMGRRRDLPAILARISREGQSPYVAVAAVGLVIAALAAIGNVKTTWSFSAFTVLIYYAITNLAALGLDRDLRLYPRFVPIAGLISWKPSSVFDL